MKKIIFTTSIFTLATFAKAQWQQTGPFTGVVQCIGVSGTNIFAGTTTGVVTSSNNGVSWIAVNNGLTNTNLLSFAIDGNNIFAGTYLGGVFLSTNSGLNWTAVNNGFPSNLDGRSMAINGTTIYTGTSSFGVFKSINNGGNWTAVNNGLTDITINALAISGTNIFAGTLNGGVCLSSNNGTSWTALTSGLPVNPGVAALAANGNTIIVGSYSGMFASMNSGNSWVTINNGLPPNPGMVSIVFNGTDTYVGTYIGVFASSNLGASWTAFNDGLTNTVIRCMAISGTSLFIGTSDGVWKRPLSEMTTGLRKLNIINSELRIYPNPSNGKFSISSNNKIDSVLVNNILGERMFNLPDLKHQMSFEIDLSDLDVGTYFLSIYTEENRFTKKIMIE